MLSDQETGRILKIGFALLKWPHFYSAYVIGVCIVFAMAVHIFIAFDAFKPNEGNKSSSFQNQICFIAAFKISAEFSELHTKDFF